MSAALCAVLDGHGAGPYRHPGCEQPDTLDDLAAR
jgi:hypothetical protein